MCSVHFHGLFDNSLEETIRVLQDIGQPCANFHDIFIRCRLESTIHAFFKDVWTQAVSLECRIYPMTNPQECVSLLQMYMSRFVASFSTKRFAPQPHYDWYGADGSAQNVRVDANTFSRLLWPTPFKPPKKSSPNLVSFDDKPKPRQPVVELTGNTPSRYRGVQNVEPCLWDMARQLGHKHRDGTVVSCTGTKCIPELQHVPVDQVQYHVAVSLLKKKKWSKPALDMFEKLFAKNRKQFAANN
jgi:hypothetical protein